MQAVLRALQCEEPPPELTYRLREGSVNTRPNTRFAEDPGIESIVLILASDEVVHVPVVVVNQGIL